jgi:hypothetical protein
MNNFGEEKKKKKKLISCTIVKKNANPLINWVPAKQVYIDMKKERIRELTLKETKLDRLRVKDEN